MSDWEDKNQLPPERGYYKVLVDWDDEGKEQLEQWDYFDGKDWDFYGYRQFINKWRLPEEGESIPGEFII